MLCTHFGRLLWSYDDNWNLVLTAKGREGCPEMIQHVSDDKAQYMIIRLPDRKDENDTVRDVFIGWTGPNVKRIQAAKIKSNDFEYCKGVLLPVI